MSDGYTLVSKLPFKENEMTLVYGILIILFFSFLYLGFVWVASKRNPPSINEEENNEQAEWITARRLIQ